jgi:hypothetical protein
MKYVRYEIFMAATMKNAVFWDVSWHFRGMSVHIGSTQHHIPEDGVLHR